MPLFALFSVIQFTLPAACQPQAVCTRKVPVPPATGKFWLVGVMLKVQLAPAWVTVTLISAMVMNPERGMALWLASAMKLTPASPGVPEGPVVMCSQEVCVLAEYVPQVPVT